MDFIEELAAQHRLLSRMKDTVGRDYSTLFGVVTDRDDPENRGRVRAALPSKGGRYQTNWLERSVTTDGFSPPVPAVGATIEVTFRDGDPHKGVYSGVLQNNVNPLYDKDSYRLVVGNSVVTVEPDSLRLETGTAVVAIADGSIRLDVAGTVFQVADGSVTINGKAVATVGARDDDSDILISRGW